jgi:hypothetical protein
LKSQAGLAWQNSLEDASVTRKANRVPNLPATRGRLIKALILLMNISADVRWQH